MFSFKVLSAVFNRSSPLFLGPFYQHAGLNAEWISLAVNKNTIAGSLLTKELEIRTSSDAFSLKIAETKNGFMHRAWQNNQSLGKCLEANNSPFLEKYNSLINQLIETKLSLFQSELIKTQGQEMFSPTEVASEEKALEWMKVSFQILEKGLIESLTNPELLFQTLLFMGKNPKTQQLEIRLILFNLDIKYVLLENGLLRIKIYDDKNDSFGSSKKAALLGDFNFRKKEMLDELTKTISMLSAGIKIT
ncbi:MAG: hypothetical protein WC635_17810 [Bacteriovorax sp.]|jgi:hypothetical protein